MIIITLEQVPSLSRTPDTGLLVILAALFFTAILAHRLWRGKIRAEDELTAFQKDLAFSMGRYRVGFRKLQSIAAVKNNLTKIRTGRRRALPKVAARSGAMTAPRKAHGNPSRRPMLKIMLANLFVSLWLAVTFKLNHWKVRTSASCWCRKFGEGCGAWALGSTLAAAFMCVAIYAYGL